MSIRRTPNHVSKHQTMNIRKLTNSLFEDSLFTDQRNVIKEEEKERDEHDWLSMTKPATDNGNTQDRQQKKNLDINYPAICYKASLGHDISCSAFIELQSTSKVWSLRRYL